MSEHIYAATGLLFVCFVGFAFGGIFFGGLYWTIRKSMFSERPGFWLLSSSFVRVTLILYGFFLILNSQLGSQPWQQLAVCLLGFVIARSLILRRTRVKAINQLHSAKEYGHGN